MNSYFKIAVEIIVLWYFIYMVLYFVRGTRTEQLLKGLFIIGAIFVITRFLKLDAINWVLARLFPISVIALLIIFQPELRYGLARIGQFGRYEGDVEIIEEVSQAVIELSSKKIGALIAIEREVGLKTYIESGVAIDGKVTKELICSVFMPRGPLHDGALIIQHARVIAAGCLLPLSHEMSLAKSLGTRHRAAVGLSEETDAICVVVSEETGGISMSVNGKLTRDLAHEDFAKALKGMFAKKKKKRGVYAWLLAKLSPKPNYNA